MTTAYLNGEFLPLQEARISPLDRGFLFGDGIYEVVPSYDGKMVGFAQHFKRMQQGLALVEINSALSEQDTKAICQRLITSNREVLGNNIGVYLHVSRGADTRRFHAYPQGIEPTVFAFAFTLTAPAKADRTIHPGAKVAITEDLRWQRCHIKSTALLGNVMHFQQGYRDGNAETILFNHEKQITEASSSNVFIVKNGEVLTPPLDNQLLPGITRLLVLECLKRGGIPCRETTITVDQLYAADEVWLTSSGKEILPVVQVGSQTIGDGKAGPVWEQAFALYSKLKFEL
ncbi:D-alanine aminotransferase [Aestuariibacter sp. GS-14]|uniref:aminotransferase class IV n=2 Tax=Alteromonadaceae TaxID=72275 RepID=UPI00112B790A|nr:aminotransferase class IV [Aestuariibacter sp. GS-14]TPV59825.1 D-alanine aminotransferase [Aestuariibacter sp. GS-14]